MSWWYDVVDFLMPAILALVGAALYFASSWLSQKAGAIGDERTRDSVYALINRARGETYSSVRFVAQTYTDSLREARADGKLTDEEKKEALALAVGTFKTRMGAYALEELATVVGDLEEWIISEIENAVYSMGKP